MRWRRRIGRSAVAALAAALVATAALPADVGVQSAEAQDAGGEFDYQAVRDAMPRMRELSDQGSALAVKLHELMSKLEETTDGVEQRAIREEVRTNLETYRETKLKMIAVTRPLCGIRTSGMTDQAILDKIKDTNLFGVSWDDAFFDRCIRDLSQALDIPIRLQFRVVQKNRVSMKFQKAPAETILAALCNGFDLRYVIYEGEIVIYKQITPTEDRFLEYQKRHPEVKLRYWQQEDASGEYSKKKGAK